MTGSTQPWWQVLATRDLVAWTGLPPDLRYDEVADRFPVAWPGEGTATLGTSAVRTRFRVHTVDGFPQNVRVWDDDDVVVLLTGPLPALTGPFSDVLDAWGDPAARLDGRFGVLDLPAGLHVHPDRGAAVLVGPEGQALRLDLFAPGPVDRYVQRLHYREDLVERP